MPIETAASFKADFLDPDDFGVVAVLKRNGVISQEILGIFSSVSEPMLDGLGSPVMGVASSFVVSVIDAELVEIGDGLFVNNSDYDIAKIETSSDGGGMIRLILEVPDAG